ncbi:phospholipase D-like domain-containing protein [Haloarcula montana]|uniref:phospholipase D-like domain-containing protein n=1 Tax=Haloarcula montana TaxID=3111776 RepID=UPI002D788150|nr:phospholipase D-like domain-containing protein [Haloarcula sp. GH36]
MRSFVAFALICLLVTPAIGPSVAAGPESTPTATDPSIHAIYPNPVAGGDTGEFVVLDVPERTGLSRYALSDGQSTVTLPNETVTGTVALTAAPDAVRPLVDHPVVALPDHPELANSGERVRLVTDGETIDSVRYTDATEGDIGVVAGSTIRWRPLGASDRPVVTAGRGSVRAFTLPDAPDAPLEPLRTAESRVLLAGYTLTSERVADALIAAKRRGARVRVLLEGDPVGDRTRAEARTLDRLVKAGVEVRMIAGPRARYRYHHAKYAVADGRAVVLTENWKPAGTGGNSSRGWGVATEQPSVVEGLATTFRADAGWRDATRWQSYRRGRQFERGERAVGSYPRRFEPTSIPVERTELLVTPDNAQQRLIETIDDADRRIAVVQPTVGGWDEPLLRAVRRAAQRGVEVRLLLSDAWYVREENRATVERFREWADRTDSPLSARVADPAGRYEKIHAKGAVVDDRVVAGSLNWNEQAATTNREVVLLLHGSEVASYYREVFDADWQGGRSGLPLELLGIGLGVGIVAVLALRRVEFAETVGRG